MNESIRPLQLALRAAPRQKHRLHRAVLCRRCIRTLSSTSRAPPTTQSRCCLRQANVIPRQSHLRLLATVSDSRPGQTHGPIQEYDARVAAGRLREDDHQRTLVQSLQDLHEMLAEYDPPKVVIPTVESMQAPKTSFFSSILGSKPRPPPGTIVPANMPRGLYMYGDVGSGKTMLMDLFYDTLPPNIKSKTRIHFHNFMQDVHKRLHKIRMAHGNSVDGIPIVSAEIAADASVLCFDEFQCTDVADAMILRRLVESLMANGSVIVTTSNRHPNDLYKNGIQRESFIPCIKLLQNALRVLNLDSSTDYRKIPRPPSGVYHHPLDKSASTHADKWFRFLGDFDKDPPHEAKQTVWGREISVPQASGKCARFTFAELIGRATGAADYIELARVYNSFVVTEVPGMTLRERDWARRFITFIDAVYEARGKLVLTSVVPLSQLFLSKKEMTEVVKETQQSAPKESKAGKALASSDAEDHSDVDSSMRMLMDDLGLSMEMLKGTSIFSGDEEAFAFARALSRLQEMGSQEWVERGMGLESKGGLNEQQDYQNERAAVVGP